MKDDAAEERDEKKSFKKIGKEVKHLESTHKGYAAGGVANEGARVKYGRNMARVMNQTGKKAGRGR
jgi:hypothetical protein